MRKGKGGCDETEMTNRKVKGASIKKKKKKRIGGEGTVVGPVGCELG